MTAELVTFPRRAKRRPEMGTVRVAYIWGRLSVVYRYPDPDRKPLVLAEHCCSEEVALLIANAVAKTYDLKFDDQIGRPPGA